MREGWVELWLRTNAGGALNTCKSNGNSAMSSSGERVSNTWTTYLQDGDNIPKGMLIPNKAADSHESVVKGGLYL